MKKIFIFFLLIFAVFFPGKVVNADTINTAKVEISLPDSICINQDFTAEIKVNNANDFFGASFELIYDPSLIQVTGITPGDIFGENEGKTVEVLNQYDNSLGTLTYCKILSGSQPGILGDKTFLKVNFKSLKKGKIKFSFTQDQKANLQLDGSNVRILLSDSTAKPIGYTFANVEKEITDNVPVSVTGIKLDKASMNIETGKTSLLTATIEPDNASNKSIIWSSDKPDIANVDQTGLVTGYKAGTATITAKTADGSYTAICKVNVVIPISVSSIKLKTTSLKLGLNQTCKLMYTISPSNATNKEVTWSSSDSKIAAVDQEGNVKAAGKGTAKITVTTVSGNKTAYCNVSVIPVESIIISKATIDVKPGCKVSLKATVYPTSSVNKNIIWESSNKEIAVVDAKGYVTGIKDGTVSIYARSQENKDIFGECKVNVATPVSSIKLNITSITITTPENFNRVELIPAILPVNATNKKVIWNSSNTNVAIVDDFGNVKAVGLGTAKITAKTESGNKTASCTIKVIDPAKMIFVESINLKNVKTGTHEGILSIGKTGTISAKVTGAGGKTPTNKLLAWESSDSSIAEVDSKGKVTPKAPGKVTITATALDGTKVSASKEIQIVQPVKLISLIKSKTIAAGEETELVAIVLPAGITQDDIKIVWSKSDKNVYSEFEETEVMKKDASGNLISSVLEVDDSGNLVSKIKLKGIKAGTVTLTLTITTKDGTYKKVTCKVLVK